MILTKQNVQVQTTFCRLPSKLVASKIFSRLSGSERQRTRTVCRNWKLLIDHYYGIKVQVTDANWEWVKSNKRVVCARMTNVISTTRTTTQPRIPLTLSLKYLEVNGEITYEFLLPILRQCLSLQSLTVSVPAGPFTLSRSMYMKSFDGRDWLPRLTTFKLICPKSTEEGYWSQIDFIEMMFRILNSAPVSHLDIIADGSDWWLPFQSMFHIQIPLINIFFEDVVLPRAKFLPIHHIQESLHSISFKNDYTLKFATLYPGLCYNSWLEPALPLEYFNFDIGSGRMWISKGWDKILKNQTSLLELVYELHYGSEMRKRVVRVLNSNVTLKVLKLYATSLASHGMEPFDGGWFHKLVNLETLKIIGDKSDGKIFFKKHLPMLTRPWYLPTSLKTLIVHGYIDCGRVDPGTALGHLDRLMELELMGRYKSPWFSSDWKPIFEMNSALLENLYESLQKLEYLKLLWIKTFRSYKSETVEQAFVNGALKDWCDDRTSMTIKTFQCQNEALCSEVRMWDR